MKRTIPPAMGLTVIHVLESLERHAGSAAICVAGLVRELGLRGIDSELIAVESARFELAGQADLVHFHGWGSAAFRAIARMLERGKTPYIVSPLGGLCANPFAKVSLWQRIAKLFKKDRTVNEAAAVTAVNEVELQALTTQRIHDRVQILGYGLDFSGYVAGTTKSVHGGTGSGLTALVLGPIHPVEGLVPLLKAGAEAGLDAQGWNIVFAGPEVGDWRKMIEAAVNRKGAAGRVRFVGAADEAVQRALLATADLLVAPAILPRCPVSILQAVSMGVPVIATRAACPSGLERLVHVCEPSREGLRSALREFIKKDVAERYGTALRAREEAVKQFDWSVLADSYATLYESVLGITSVLGSREAMRFDVVMPLEGSERAQAVQEMQASAK